MRIGRTREDLLSSRLFRYTHPDDADPDREGFRKQVTGDLEFYSIEKRLVRPDGRNIWVSVRSSPVRSASDELLYVVRVVQDARKSAGLEVTDRIELWWQVGGSPEPAEAIRTHAEQLAGEVLATALHEGAPGTDVGCRDHLVQIRRCLRRGSRRGDPGL